MDAPHDRAASLSDLSMTEMADAFRHGEARAEAMVNACLDRIERHDGKVNTVIRLDRGAALERAAAADKARAAGDVAPGPLAGVPIMHKDMYYREGRVSTCGSRIRRVTCRMAPAGCAPSRSEETPWTSR